MLPCARPLGLGGGTFHSGCEEVEEGDVQRGEKEAEMNNGGGGGASGSQPFGAQQRSFTLASRRHLVSLQHRSFSV